MAVIKLNVKEYTNGETKVYDNRIIEIEELTVVGRDIYQSGKYASPAVSSEYILSIYRDFVKNEDYTKAINKGETEKVQHMLESEAKEKGYSPDSSYQGTSAFNGKAPGDAGWYASKEEAVVAWEEGSFEGDWTLADTLERGIDNGDLYYHLSERNYRFADENKKEAISNIKQVVNGRKDTITMYRSVPSDVKENNFRNGDWITPSKGYAIENAEIHGWGNNYRIIEQTVSIEDVWWDGNDIAEWGYDNGSEKEVYKNTPNNVKLLDVTYDDNGKIIPLTERFDENKSDIRYSMKENEWIIEEGIWNSYGDGAYRRRKFEENWKKKDYIKTENGERVFDTGDCLAYTKDGRTNTIHRVVAIIMKNDPDDILDYYQNIKEAIRDYEQNTEGETRESYCEALAEAHSALYSRTVTIRIYERNTDSGTTSGRGAETRIFEARSRYLGRQNGSGTGGTVKTNSSTTVIKNSLKEPNNSLYNEDYIQETMGKMMEGLALNGKLSEAGHRFSVHQI